jgi:hypothetical protein
MSGARQPDLFGGSAGLPAWEAAEPPGELPLERDLLLDWQRRVARLQQEVVRGCREGRAPGQLTLLADGAGGAGEKDPMATAAALDPSDLAPQSLDFWRWPAAPHRGAAIYFVLDRPPHLEAPLLLYVGETGRADLRWKGEHDCKSYLAAYGEALRRTEVPSRPSIRFWCDVPVSVRPRRAVEQALIRLWLPPFNKETRERWATPFTADLP